MKKSPNKISVTARGRRKTAVALVKFIDGSGKISINNKEIANPSRIYTEPLKIVGYDQKVDISVKVLGGGIIAQAGAIRLAIARALDKINPDFRKTLKIEGMLTRDPRMTERKKPGLKKARRAPQWQKR
ncbi:MAG: 30S ribosomal protein S9 [Patescibacteria group bacterium]